MACPSFGAAIGQNQQGFVQLPANAVARGFRVEHSTCCLTGWTGVFPARCAERQSGYAQAAGLGPFLQQLLDLIGMDMSFNEIARDLGAGDGLEIGGNPEPPLDLGHFAFAVLRYGDGESVFT